MAEKDVLELCFEKNDPFNLLYKKVDSMHCEQKKSTIIEYNHLGELYVVCDCGKKYFQTP